MKIAIDIVNDSQSDTTPELKQCQSWLESALAHLENSRALELSIRFVESTEIQRLNREYRSKDKPTNVLSFPSQIPEAVAAEMDSYHLGDIAICSEIVESEAQAQNKQLDAHWAHLLIHGLLHLLGYDHDSDEQASEMENLEIQILKTLGFPDPYLVG